MIRFFWFLAGLGLLATAVYVVSEAEPVGGVYRQHGQFLLAGMGGAVALMLSALPSSKKFERRVR